MFSVGRATLLAYGFTLLLLLPLLAVVVAAAPVVADAGSLLAQLGSTLPRYLGVTLLLCLLTVLVALALALPCAWFTGHYQFAGRQVLGWLAILPLAIPAYVSAYAYTDALDYSGWLSTWAREGLMAVGLLSEGFSPSDWPEIRSLWGAAFVLAFSLSPYITLLARTAFEERQGRLLEAGRSLGLPSRALFWRVALPMARPAIVAGSALVMMECLADFGTVEFFSVQTLSTGLFRTWFGYGDRAGAAALGLVLMSVASLVLVLEKTARGRAEYAAQKSVGALEPRPLVGSARIWVPLLCSLPGLFGFLVPVALLVQAGRSAEVAPTAEDLLTLAAQSAHYGLVAALVVVGFGLLLGYQVRGRASRAMKTAVRLATSGYAAPGLVVAVGMLLLSMAVTQLLDWGLGVIMTLTTTHLLVLGGYFVRFFAVGYSPIEAGYSRVAGSLEWSARTLGLRPSEVLRRVHFPLLRRSLWVGGLFVFVDVVKELPLTLVLRPLNVETLAVAAHNFASDERLAEAAYPSLLIVLVGLIPVLLLGPAGSQGAGRLDPNSPVSTG